MSYSMLGVGVGLQESEDFTVTFNDVLTRHREYLKSIEPPSRPPLSQIKPEAGAATKHSFSVYTDIEFLKKALSWAEWSIVDDPKQADILWFNDDVGKIEDILNDGQMINQFPNESCITFKHKLVETVTRCWGQQCRWLPVTYNLNTQLPQFIAHWREIEEQKDTKVFFSLNFTLYNCI